MIVKQRHGGRNTRRSHFNLKVGAEKVHMSILSACVSVYYMHAICLLKSKEVVRSPGTGVTEPICGYWESDLGSQQ